MGAEPPSPASRFALVLLIYSALFALWRWLTGPPVPRRGRPLGGRHVVTAVAAITACSFAVRLWFTARSGQIGDLHLWQWPACAGMFVFGVVTARHRWDRHIPDAVHRGCRSATLATLILLPALALATGVRDVATDAGPFLGGPHPQARPRRRSRVSWSSRDRSGWSGSPSAVSGPGGARGPGRAAPSSRS